MLEISGEPVILKNIKRISNEFGKDNTVFSTSTNVKDDYMSQFIENHGFKVYRGEENNLANRFIEASIDNKFQYIARVTGDDLFRDLETIKYMHEEMITKNYDYIFSDDLMLGCNSEIMKVDTLFFIDQFAKLKNETHALSFFLDRIRYFLIKKYLAKIGKRPQISLAIDELHDFKSIKKFWERK